MATQRTGAGGRTDSDAAGPQGHLRLTGDGAGNVQARALPSPMPNAEPICLALQPEDSEDWLGELRAWVELCRHGHEPRAAWSHLQHHASPHPRVSGIP